MDPTQQATNMTVGDGSGILATIGDMNEAKLAKQRLTSKLTARSFGFTVLDSYIMYAMLLAAPQKNI